MSYFQWVGGSKIHIFYLGSKEFASKKISPCPGCRDGVIWFLSSFFHNQLYEIDHYLACIYLQRSQPDVWKFDFLLCRAQLESLNELQPVIVSAIILNSQENLRFREEKHSQSGPSDIDISNLWQNSFPFIARSIWSLQHLHLHLKTMVCNSHRVTLGLF